MDSLIPTFDRIRWQMVTKTLMNRVALNLKEYNNKKDTCIHAPWGPGEKRALYTSWIVYVLHAYVHTLN